jgi:hypothetical protein
MKLSAVTKQSHESKSWQRFASYEFAGRECFVPVTAAEVPDAALSLPLAFVRQKDHFILAAVLSLIPGINLFVSPDGQWLGKYVPSEFRGYPFRLARGGPEKELMLCVDEDSGLVHADRTSGDPFFDHDGELSKPVNEVLTFLTHQERSRTVTRERVADLAAAGLIQEWPLTVRINDREKKVLGLHRIDEAKLNALETGPFLDVRRALPIAYAQMLSMGHVMELEKMAQQYQMAPQQQQMEDKTPDFLAAFGDDDMISFE